jgi:hypothetical protein
VGSAMERSSSGSEEKDDSSEDSWVDFASKERIVDFPEEVVLPVRRWLSSSCSCSCSWSFSGSAVGGGEEGRSEGRIVWRRGDDCWDLVDL